MTETLGCGPPFFLYTGGKFKGVLQKQFSEFHQFSRLFLLAFKFVRSVIAKVSDAGSPIIQHTVHDGLALQIFNASIKIAAMTTQFFYRFFQNGSAASDDKRGRKVLLEHALQINKKRSYLIWQGGVTVWRHWRRDHGEYFWRRAFINSVVFDAVVHDKQKIVLNLYINNNRLIAKKAYPAGIKTRSFCTAILPTLIFFEVLRKSSAFVFANSKQLKTSFFVAIRALSFNYQHTSPQR